MRRPIIALACVVCLAGGAVGAMLVRDSEAPDVERYNEPTVNELVVREINRVRQQRGIPPIRTSRQLEHSASGYARLLADGLSFGHLPDLPIPDRFQTKGEVLAYSRDASPRAVVRQWMGSPSHRAVLLDPRFTFAGVARDQRGLRYFWVGHFGKRW